MRDAFGSTFMFKLIIIFIVFYVSFMTIAVGYAKVFKIKNGVINILEQNQFDSSLASDWNHVIEGKVDTYLSNLNYKYADNKAIKDNCDKAGGRLSNNGACIVSNKLSNASAYYEVIVYLVVSFPLFDFDFVIPISGETSVIDF